MSKVANSSIKMATNYMNQRSIACTSDGTLWTFVVDGTVAKFFYSTNNGDDWIHAANSNFSTVVNGSFTINNQDEAVLVYREAVGIYYRRATLNSSKTDWVWGPKVQVVGDSSWNYPAQCSFHWNGNDYTWAVYSNTSETRYSIITNGTAGSSLPVGIQVGDARSFPSIDFEHTGDGKTPRDNPNIYLCYDKRSKEDGIFYQKYDWTGTSWQILVNDPILENRTLAYDQNTGDHPDDTWFKGFYNGQRFYVVGYFQFSELVEDVDGTGVAVDKEFLSVGISNDGGASSNEFFTFEERYRVHDGNAGYDSDGNLYVVGRGWPEKMPDFEIVDEPKRDGDGNPIIDPATGQVKTTKVVLYPEPAGDPSFVWRRWSFETAHFEEGTKIDENADTNQHVSVRLASVYDSDGRQAIDAVWTDGFMNPFTVEFARVTTLNTAPSVSFTGDDAVDRTATVRRTWTFDDPDAGDRQTKYHYRWRVDGNTAWDYDSGVTVSSNGFIDLDANTLPDDDVEEQLQVWDGANAASGYITNVFRAADTTANPTIDSTSVDATGNITVDWSASDQTDYQVRVLDGDTTLNDSGVITSTDTAHVIASNANGKDVDVQVRVKGASGLWSAYVSATVTVNYDKPGTPSLTATANVHKIDLALTTPNGDSNFDYADIYRKGDGQEIRIATNVSGSYTDYAVASAVDYQYKVRSIGTNGSYAESGWVS